MAQGNIILLNGTSSAGKTTLAKVLQKQLDEPYLHMGNDQFFGKNRPDRLIQFSENIEQATSDWWTVVIQNDRFVAIKVGDRAISWLTGMYRAMATWSQTGHHLIGDVVLHNERIWKAASATFHTLPVWLIRVYCPLDVAEKHEREREETRLIGGARVFYEGAYRFDIADLTVNTAEDSPEACAHQIITRITSDNPPTAFSQLQQMFTSNNSSSEMMR